MPKFRVALCFVVLLAICQRTAPAAELVPDMASKIAKWTNTYRKENKKQPLHLSAALTRAAQQHALNMATQEQMAHELDGKTYEDRVRATGYVAQAAGENVATATGQPDNAKTMLVSWKKSEPHRANMLGEQHDFTEIGVGVAVSKTGTYYGCQVFGIPQGGARK